MTEKQQDSPVFVGLRERTASEKTSKREKEGNTLTQISLIHPVNQETGIQPDHGYTTTRAATTGPKERVSTDLCVMSNR